MPLEQVTTNGGSPHNPYPLMRELTKRAVVESGPFLQWREWKSVSASVRLKKSVLASASRKQRRRMLKCARIHVLIEIANKIEQAARNREILETENWMLVVMNGHWLKMSVLETEDSVLTEIKSTFYFRRRNPDA